MILKTAEKTRLDVYCVGCCVGKSPCLIVCTTQTPSPDRGGSLLCAVFFTPPPYIRLPDSRRDVQQSFPHHRSMLQKANTMRIYACAVEYSLLSDIHRGMAQGAKQSRLAPLAEEYFINPAPFPKTGYAMLPQESIVKKSRKPQPLMTLFRDSALQEYASNMKHGKHIKNLKLIL